MLLPVGPHRADVDIRVDGVLPEQLCLGPAKLIASIALSYSAELAVRRGTQPILLLDDFGAELDDTHRERFLGNCEHWGAR